MGSSISNESPSFPICSISVLLSLPANISMDIWFSLWLIWITRYTVISIRFFCVMANSLRIVLIQAPSPTTTSTTHRPMPTLAAVPSQRATQAPTKRNKRPNVNNEIPATVRVQHTQHPDQIWRIIDQPSNIEYTIYTFHVNIHPTHSTLPLHFDLLHTFMYIASAIYAHMHTKQSQPSFYFILRWLRPKPFYCSLHFYCLYYYYLSLYYTCILFSTTTTPAVMPSIYLLRGFQFIRCFFSLLLLSPKLMHHVIKQICA